MNNFQENPKGIPKEQLRIRAKCYHPSGIFEKFKGKDIEQSIPDRFEQQVRRYPHRIAIKHGVHQFTYYELNHSANRISGAILAKRDLKPEPIALLLNQIPSQISSVLGVMKAGKFYVPLDPSFPLTRISSILEDTQANLILTDSENLALAEVLTENRLQVINIDKIDENLSLDDINLFLSPDSLAWILYTSGSTGRPKGVVQSHRNALHFTMNLTNYLHICPDDRVGLLYSYGANAWSHRCFMSLLNGASLYSFNIKEEVLNGMESWLIEHRITIYDTAPTVYRSFVSTLIREEQFPELRIIQLGGEPVYKRDIELYKKYFSTDCIFINRLGSSETGSLLFYFIDKNTKITTNMVPVGYPVKDNTILLIDSVNDEVQCPGVGEIVVKSRYLTPGYWQRNDLTRSAFLPNRTGDIERIYRTGDKGRSQTDGCVICLGRKDFQVKVRGHRVELAEVELALLEIDSIRQAVAVARDAQTGENRLFAYVVPNSKPPPSVRDLRAALSKKLPDFMIPSVFIILGALPLTANGKIDRQALPEPGNDRPELENLFVPARTPIEQTLAEIWSEILIIEPVGIHDKFLELGGNSLLATRIISRVINTFQVKLSLQSLLAAPTIAEMAVLIAQNRADGANQEELDRILTDLENLSDKEAKERTKLI